MPQRIIILGSSGYIGRALYEGFSHDRNFEVVGHTSQTCDLLSREATEKALGQLTRSDIVVMAAAITRVKENSFEAMVKNIQMAENLGRLVTDKQAGQVIYLSTIDVYGCLEANFRNKGLKITEQFELRPDDYYGISKVAGELILRRHLLAKKIPLSILRLPGVYGGPDDQRSLIASFIRKITQEGSITVYGDGSDRRDYLYIEDVFHVVKETIRLKFNGSVNAVTGQSYSILEIAQLVKSLSQRDCAFTFEPDTDASKLRIKALQFDNSFFAKTFSKIKLKQMPEGISAYLKLQECPR